MAESGDQHHHSQRVLCFCYLTRIHTWHHAERVIPGRRAGKHTLDTQKCVKFVNRKNPDGPDEEEFSPCMKLSTRH